MTEKIAGVTAAQVTPAYIDKRNYFGVFGSSVPLFLANGNHDGEQGWLLNGTANNEATWAATARNLYHPNTSPDSFYSGDTISEPFGLYYFYHGKP
jgi:hypothetical protein